MRRRFICLSFSVCVALSLSGCGTVMGPDLMNRPTPFVPDGSVHLNDPNGVIDATITAAPVGDSAVVTYALIGVRPYRAHLTYRPFTPIIAETIADRKDYWLVGVNMSQTPDRTFYAVLRYPHGKPLQPHTTRKDFEVLVLMCNGDPKPAVDEAAAAQVAPSTEAASGDDDVFCYHDTAESVEAYAGEYLKSQGGYQPGTPTGSETESAWQKLTVTTP